MSNDDKPKTVEARPLAYCQEHKTGLVAVKDETGNVEVASYRLADPDFPSDQPTLQVTGRTEDGWYSGEVRASSGPPKVTSEAYRRGWERIFGNKAVEGEA